MPDKMTRQVVEENVNKSRRRMDVACLDMMQFHWYDFTIVLEMVFAVPVFLASKDKRCSDQVVLVL